MTADTTPIYKHTPDMGEISGFGGGYEALCQDMLNAGVVWLTAHRYADLQASGYKGVFGVLKAESDDAKAMEAAMMAADTKQDCTGAMHHAVMSRLFWISANGWDAYCAELRQRKAAGE